MQVLTQQISEHIAQLPEGTAIGAKELLHFGSRAGVDQALSRLTRRKKLMRVGRGLYVRPIETRFGIRAPSAEKVVEGIASARGETIARHGAAAANSLGLTTQVPVRSIYLTSGPSRQLKLGAQRVELKHAPRWQMMKAGHPVGEAVRALAWLGPEHTHEALATLRQRLPKSQLQEIASARTNFPGWLAQRVSSELVANG